MCALLMTSSHSKAPNYTPKWHPHKTWCFGAQYFFELFNKTSNSTHAHAATGTTFNCTPGEVIFTEFTLSKDWVWTLQMGVKGDKTRLSTVVAKQPFMGMISDETSSWKEDVYSKAWSNTCWELYGVKGPNDYPQSDMRYTIEISTDKPGQPQAPPPRSLSLSLSLSLSRVRSRSPAFSRAHALALALALSLLSPTSLVANLCNLECRVVFSAGSIHWSKWSTRQPTCPGQ